MTSAVITTGMQGLIGVVPDYLNVALHLPGDGTNGSTVFTDQKGHSMTRISGSTATIATATSKFGGAAMAFTGNGGIAYTGADSYHVDFDFSGKFVFTVRLWVRPNGTGPGTYETFIDTRNNQAGTNGFYFGLDPSGTMIVFTGTNTIMSDSAVMTRNGAFQHVEFTADGTYVYLFRNGALVATNSISGVFDTQSDGRSFIGGSPNGSLNLVGIIDDFQLINGVCLHTTAFIPPNAPLPFFGITPSADISPSFDYCTFATHLDGTNGTTVVTDVKGSSNPTFAGTAAISTTQFKFGTSSAKFNADGGIIYATGAPDDRFSFLGDFTVRCWLYAAAAGAGTFRVILDTRAGTGANSTGYGVFIYVSPSNFLSVGTISGSVFTDTVAFPTNQWVHFALSRIGTTFIVHKNGIVVGRQSPAVQSLNDGRCVIGDVNPEYQTTLAWNGYIDDFQIVNGQSMYLGNFNVPLLPFTTPAAAVDPTFANVSLAMHFDGANGSTTFTDQKAHSVIRETPSSGSNTAAITTSQFKFGTGCLQLNGDGGLIGNGGTFNSAFDFGTGDYCIRFWVRPTTYPFGQGGIFATTTGNNGVNISFLPINNQNTGVASVYLTVSTYNVSWTDTFNTPFNTWTHIQVSSVAGTLYVFKGGSKVYSVADPGTASGSSDGLCLIGTLIQNYFMIGQIDDLEVIKGQGLNSASFLPPVVAFANT